MVGTTRVMNELIARANGPEAAAEIVRQADAMAYPTNCRVRQKSPFLGRKQKSLPSKHRIILLELGLSEQDHVAPVFDATPS